MQHCNSENSKLILAAIAKVLKEQRLKLKKSQRLLADEFDIQKSMLSRLESATNEPKILSLFSVCEALDIQVSDLFRMVEKELPSGITLIDK